MSYSTYSVNPFSLFSQKRNPFTAHIMPYSISLSFYNISLVNYSNFNLTSETLSGIF